MTGYYIYDNEPTQMYNRSIKLKDTKRFNEAREGFRKVERSAVASSNLAHESAYYIGICYYLEGDYRAAIKAFTDLIERYPNGNRTPESYYNVGRYHFRLGQKQQGIDRMRLLVKKHPGTMWAGFARDRLIEHNALE